MEQPQSTPRPDRPAEAGLFDIYKMGQGYWVRMCTAFGGAALILAGADFLWKELSVFNDADRPWTFFWFQVLPALIFMVGLSYLLFWVVGRNRTSADFMIATEGEMKKVSWSTRREVIGSTKVVIIFLLLIGLLLFAVDVLFMLFFTSIGVLRGTNPWTNLFGGGS